MNAWAAVVAAIAGGAIALAGQNAGQRRDKQVRVGELLLEACEQVVSLSDDFRNRLWEEVELGQEGRVGEWNLLGNQLAVARIKLLTDDHTLLQRLEGLTASGKAMGAYWRCGNVDRAELSRRREGDKIACADFVAASSARAVLDDDQP
jgi:hypothetical protein